MAPYLSASAAKARDPRLVGFTDEEIDARIEAFEPLAEGYRGTAYVVRHDVWHGATNPYGAFSTGRANLRAVVAVDADEARTMTDAVFNGTTTMTSATGEFTTADVGRLLISDGVPAGTVIIARTNGTTVDLSTSVAEATGATVTIGDALTVDSFDRGTGRVVLTVAGDIVAAVTHGLATTPPLLLDACTSYVAQELTSRKSGHSRNTITEATEAGTTRYSTPDRAAGRPTGWLDVDEKLNNLPDFRPGVGIG